MKYKEILIKSDGYVTDIFIDGVEIENVSQITFTAVPFDVVCNIDKYDGSEIVLETPDFKNEY